MSNIQTKFHVSGMTCDGCVKSATAAVMSVLGVEQASFDFSAATGTVVGDCDPQAVCEALNEAGFPAVVNSAA